MDDYVGASVDDAPQGAIPDAADRSYGKRAFVAGVADDRGYGWAIARALAARAHRSASAPGRRRSASLRRAWRGGSWTGGFLRREIDLEKIYPLDAVFDVPEDVPEEVRQDKRYRELTGFTIQEVADALRADFGESCLDVLVHSLANGPEVRSALIDTTRAGYLAAVSASAYSSSACSSGLVRSWAKARPWSP